MPKISLETLLLFVALATACETPTPSSEESVGTRVAHLSDAKFLVHDGVGSEQQALDYYASIDPKAVVGQYTLDEWTSEHIGQMPTFSGFYRNATELGFWREMLCSRYIGRGVGGCRVRNWTEPGDKAAGKPDLGTVTMNISSEGFTRFYVFAPGGKLSPLAILDSEGEKYVPHVCIVCHNGTYKPNDTGADLSAIFREFEPSILDALPGSNPSQEWFDLNQSIRSANTALRTENEGSAAGLDHARRAQNVYAKAMYETISPPRERNIRDPFHLPPSWQAQIGETPQLVLAKKEIWTQLVSPYCMTCHRTNGANWADYGQFQPLASRIGTDSFLGLYLAAEDKHLPGMPYMPQPELLFAEYQRDASAKASVTKWVNAVESPQCQVGTLCTPSKVCYAGVINSCEPGRFACVPTHPLPNGTACGSESVCHNGTCVNSFSFSLPIVLPGVYVRNEKVSGPERHLHINVPGGQKIVLSEFDKAKGCRKTQGTRTLSCNAGTRTCTDSSLGDSWKLLEEGASFTRKRPSQPGVEGKYRLESPVSIPDCS
ncbi:MAG: hypothetical protein ACT4TC_19290 [Myxococcaceae bacterium]